MPQHRDLLTSALRSDPGDADDSGVVTSLLTPAGATVDGAATIDAHIDELDASLEWCPDVTAAVRELLDVLPRGPEGEVQRQRLRLMNVPALIADRGRRRSGPGRLGGPSGRGGVPALSARAEPRPGTERRRDPAPADRRARLVRPRTRAARHRQHRPGCCHRPGTARPRRPAPPGRPAPLRGQGPRTRPRRTARPVPALSADPRHDHGLRASRRRSEPMITHEGTTGTA